MTLTIVPTAAPAAFFEVDTRERIRTILDAGAADNARRDYAVTTNSKRFPCTGYSH